MENCQLCEEKPAKYDCKIPGMMGSWGNICQECFDSNGCALGLGKGQVMISVSKANLMTKMGIPIVKN